MMNDDLAKRVRSAAIAGWWTVLVATVFLTIQWFAYLAFSSCRPGWVQKLWGPETTWPDVRVVWLWISAIFKMIVWVMILVVIWLSLWARRLKRA